MSLTRLLNVFYAELVDRAGGDAEGRRAIDEALGATARRDPEEERRRTAQRNQEAFGALAAAFRSA